MNDGELIGSFEPGPAECYLLVRFDDPELMVRAQERIVMWGRETFEDGPPTHHAEPVVAARGTLGRRELMGGRVSAWLLATTPEAVEEAESLRRGVNLAEMKDRAPIGGGVQSEAWRLTTEHLDYLIQWVERAVDVYPAGGGWRPRAKVHRIRDGFNCFVQDQDRPDLVLNGTAGGVAFSDFIRNHFKDDVQYVRVGSNPYFRGLVRKPGAKKDWFPTIQGADE